MTARRRRALASAVGAVIVAILCAALSSNVDGGQRTLLLVLTVAWLVIAAGCVGNALRTAAPADSASTAPVEPATGDDGMGSDPR